VNILIDFKNFCNSCPDWLIVSSENTIPKDKREVVKFSGLRLTRSQSRSCKILFSHWVTCSQLKLAQLETFQKFLMKGMLSSISSYLEASMRRVTPYKYMDLLISSEWPDYKSLSSKMIAICKVILRCFSLSPISKIHSIRLFLN